MMNDGDFFVPSQSGTIKLYNHEEDYYITIIVCCNICV